MPSITLSNDAIRQAIAAAGYGTPEPGKLHILGVRGALPANGRAGTNNRLETVPNTTDAYNDTLVLFGTRLEVYRGSVDPGLWYTEKPLHPEGCAHLLNGGPYAWEFGPHKGKPALVQAEPFPFWRDADRDSTRDKTAIERRVRREVIGLDIHAGGSSPVVGPNSAACLIVWGGWNGNPWQQFYSACRASHQKRMLGWLLDAESLL